ncbi:(-)-isopiperitenol/(-)-carveol dehydrogenase, mitochondrial-like [Bidens hawaiensis]|uniref:(-)-isopiperitenol/(-)-carveol dehydrogenase, mitochondrial-like n=1 Tax=Bidens hawaiensis TaxID=980011 RepID=UPI00404A49A6
MTELNNHNTPPLTLNGKITIITGGASGIGEATARLFARHGATVVIADIQDVQGRLVADSIGSSRCTYFHCDISDEQQVISAVNFTVKSHGRLDVIFCNAGIVSTSKQTVLDLDLNQLDALYNVNARGTAACVKHAARAMVERRVRGSIICTASVAASRGACVRTDYVMTKHAVLGLVRSASKQLGVYGIRVNSVSPSAVVTPLSRRSPAAAKKTMELYEALSSLKGKELCVEDVAEAVVFLASDGSGFITGHDLAVDGGLTKLPDVEDMVMYNC